MDFLINNYINDLNTIKNRLLLRREELCKEASKSHVLSLRDDEYDRLMSRNDLAIFKWNKTIFVHIFHWIKCKRLPNLVSLKFLVGQKKHDYSRLNFSIIRMNQYIFPCIYIPMVLFQPTNWISSIPLNEILSENLFCKRNFYYWGFKILR